MKKLLKKNRINTILKCKGTPDEPIGSCSCMCYNFDLYFDFNVSSYASNH